MLCALTKSLAAERLSWSEAHVAVRALASLPSCHRCSIQTACGCFVLLTCCPPFLEEVCLCCYIKINGLNLLHHLPCQSCWYCMSTWLFSCGSICIHIVYLKLMKCNIKQCWNCTNSRKSKLTFNSPLQRDFKGLVLHCLVLTERGLQIVFSSLVYFDFTLTLKLYRPSEVLRKVFHV